MVDDMPRERVTVAAGTEFLQMAIQEKISMRGSRPTVFRIAEATADPLVGVAYNTT